MAERGILVQRYQEIHAAAGRNGPADGVQRLKAELDTTRAVATTVLGWARLFFEREDPLYSSYSGAVRGRARAPALPHDDARRRAVDNALYAGYGEEMTFAALSVDGLGLSSYGLIHMELSDEAIARRATVFEENSFTFTEKLKLPTGSLVPAGYLSLWHDRYMIGVIKLAAKVTNATSRSDIVSLVLWSEGDRSTDEFIEVHIYGTYSHKAVKKVRGPAGSEDPDDHNDLAKLRRLVGIDFWEDY
jgi:hypothetical protein